MRNNITKKFTARELYEILVRKSGTESDDLLIGCNIYVHLPGNAELTPVENIIVEFHTIDIPVATE